MTKANEAELTPQELAQFKELKNKRKVIKGQLTRVETFVHNYTEDQKGQILIRLKLMEGFWDKFEDIQCQIESLVLTESETSERSNFMDKYCEIMAGLQQLLDRGERKCSVGQDREMTKDIQLPPIEIPTFYGDFEHWLEFKDTVEAVINSNQSLGDIQKFYYLKRSLRGDAADLIKSLENATTSFGEAWNLLRENYENKKLIATSHLESLFNFPPINKESYSCYRKFLNQIRKDLRALKSLGLPVEHWDILLLFILQMKLDAGTKKEWKRVTPLKDFSSLNDFIEFLERKVQILGTEKDGKKSNLSWDTGTKNVSKSFACTEGDGRACVICGIKPIHSLQVCKKYLGMSVNDRREAASKSNLCWNCLRFGHRVNTCRCRGCSKCGRRHNVLLHVDNIPEVISEGQGTSGSIEKNTVEKQPVTTFSAHSNNIQEDREILTEILLSTALVKVKDNWGMSHECRVLLDCGSQSSLISYEFQKRLGLPLKSININICGIGQSALKVNKLIKATVQSNYGDFEFIESFLIVDKISENIPTKSVSSNSLKIPSFINLADHSFGKMGKVDMLLGASVFWDLLCPTSIKIGTGKTTAQETKLGWVISGPVSSETINKWGQEQVQVANLSTNVGLQEQIERFWKLEEIPQERRYTKEEQDCENSFVENTVRDRKGRFIVTLPFRERIPNLGKSYDIALKRFLYMERKLSKNEDMKREYNQFIQEYIDMGHASLVDGEGEVLDGPGICYLPHHSVVRDTSITTKLRVVFDASAATSNGLSLNNKLMVGPRLQDDIFDILIRFRTHEVVLSADIAKMYRQILVSPEQRDYQRILWRFSSDDPIKIYRLNTVTYGTASAPFLAVRALQQLGYECEKENERVGRMIIKDFYMDDLLSGANSIEEAVRLKTELNRVLMSGGFILRKWTSNYRDVLCGTDDMENIDIDHYLSNESEDSKTLGLLWNSKKDILKYEITLKSSEIRKVTKRKILSSISQVFDTLGLIGPVILKAKLLMQYLWTIKKGWDEELSEDICSSWQNFKGQIMQLKELQIPRQVICNQVMEMELHCFCDASVLAYGTCLYVRSTDVLGMHKSQLLCSKSRVAPLKSISLPRLELCGALLSANLANVVIKTINKRFTKVQFWCDSSIVLSWVAGEPTDWVTFVANRTSEIQRLTEEYSWKHVESSDNPADIISRGMEVTKLKDSELWWHGPSWLNKDEREWPTQKLWENREIPERRTVRKVFVAETVNFEILDRISDLYKLQRVLGYCLRFISNCRTAKALRQTDNLTISELGKAMNNLVKISQWEDYETEIKLLQGSKSIPKSSRLLSFNPFIDKEGILRVGGRLAKSTLAFEQKHPAILSNKSRLTRLLIDYEHKRLLHAGTQALLLYLRKKYWIMSGRTTVRGIIRKCVTCSRARPQELNQLMGDLPKERLMPSRPFNNCGLDYAGPFDTMVKKVRGCTTTKTYLCIFVCFATHAVHLELVTDLTTAAFLNCFKRFVARRGLPSKIFSDNATNFVGARNELRDLVKFIREKKTQNEFDRYFAQVSISWHFIPPRSPHFGGLWESAVRVAKYHIKRVTGNQRLTFEELLTLITQIEACMNSRPLVPMTEDPDDLNILTPGHFLIGEPLSAPPQIDLSDVKTTKLVRYQLITQMVQSFWRRWSQEYLTNLQQRSKWKTLKKDVELGQLVILKNEDLPPLKWQMGRIVTLHPGTDGVIRVVTVKTSNGLFRRAITQLALLPIEV